MNKRTYTSLLAPVVTEKSTQMNEGGKYAFYVDPSATKKHIKDAVRKVYGVEVDKVNILKVPAKTRWGKNRKAVTKRQKRVKAIVTTKDAKKIDINKIQ